MRPHRALGAMLLVPALLLGGIGSGRAVEREAEGATAVLNDNASVLAAAPTTSDAPRIVRREPTARITTTTKMTTTAKTAKTRGSGKSTRTPLEPAPAPSPIAPTEPVPVTHTDPSTSSGTESTTTVRRTVPVGVTVPWGPLDRTRLTATTTTLGTAPVMLQWYTGFGEPVDVPKLQAVVDAGATPVITWEPWKYTDGLNQPTYALSTFPVGKHDAYLTAWADAIAQWKGPVMIRFAHEMNGSWYPWAAGVNGNTAADYVAAWRHVHGIFAARGATNVQWVWSPIVVSPNSTPLGSLYPGDAYVDFIGVDGYNGGTAMNWGGWTSSKDVFGATFAELRALAPDRPLLIAETASTELGGDKAAWITELFEWAAPQSDLRGIIWFDENKETDWRVASSAAATEAFRAAVTP